MATIITAADPAAADWAAREPGPELGVLAKAAWAEWAAEGDANGWVTLVPGVVVKTGDGHGHHIPGTPNVYTHGWKPVAGTPASAAATAGDASDQPKRPRPKSLAEFLRTGWVVAEIKPTGQTWNDTHITIFDSGDIIVSQDKPHRVAAGEPEPVWVDREELGFLDAETSHQAADLIRQIAQDASDYEPNEPDDEDEAEDDTDDAGLFIDYDTAVGGAVFAGYTSDGEVRIGWLRDDIDAPDLTQIESEDDAHRYYNLWSVDFTHADWFADALDDMGNDATDADENPEYVDGTALEAGGELARYHDYSFSFNDDDGEQLLWARSSAQLRFLRERLVGYRDRGAGRPGSEWTETSISGTTFRQDPDGTLSISDDSQPGYMLAIDPGQLDDVIETIDMALAQAEEHGRERHLQAGRIVKAATAVLGKVGPKGYVHGWVYVGKPYAGAHVHHPEHGWGEVVDRDDQHTRVRFESGEEASFEHGTDDAGHFRPRDPDKPRPMYHGTVTQDIEQIQPASQHRRGVVFPHDTDPDYAYATTDPDIAWHYAEMAEHASAYGRGRVYLVSPTGSVETDPSLDAHGRHRSNYDSDVRSRDPFDVVDEVPRRPDQRWMDEQDDDDEDEWKAATPDLTKVGPKGYIHGWIYVGPPTVGAAVHHPEHGPGTVRRHSKKTMGVDFESGLQAAFEHASETPDPAEHFTLRGGGQAKRTPMQRRTSALDAMRRWSGNPYRISYVEQLTAADWKSYTDDDRTQILEGLQRLHARGQERGESEIEQRAKALLDRFTAKPAAPRPMPRNAKVQPGDRVEWSSTHDDGMTVQGTVGRDRRTYVDWDSGRREYINASKLGPGVRRLGLPPSETAAATPKLSRAQRRQAKLDRIRGVAELLTEVEELHHNRASQRAMQHRIRSRARAGDVPDDIRDQLLDAWADPHTMIEQIAARHRLTRIGRTGEQFPFDPKVHERLGGYTADDQRGRLVEVMRPGYQATVGRGDTVNVHKPIVADVIPPPPVDGPAARRARYRQLTQGTNQRWSTLIGSGSEEQARIRYESGEPPWDIADMLRRASRDLARRGQRGDLTDFEVADTLRHDQNSRNLMARGDARTLATLADLIERGSGPRPPEADLDRLRSTHRQERIARLRADLADPGVANREIKEDRLNELLEDERAATASVLTVGQKRARAGLAEAADAAPAARQEILRGYSAPDLREMIRVHGLVGLVGGRTALGRMKKPDLIAHLTEHL